MDLLGYLIIVALAAGLIMNVGANTAAQRRRTAMQLAAVERKLNLIMDHLGIVESEPPMPDVIAYLEQGKKINAVKAYRDATGAGLLEAKEAVERIAHERGLHLS